MNAPTDPFGTLEVALAHAARLLERSPELGLAQVGEILKIAPTHPQARLLLASAQRLCGDVPGALQILRPLAAEQPRAAAVFVELGVAEAEAEQSANAIRALEHAVTLAPDTPHPWRVLADQYDAIGDVTRADQARARFLKAANKDPRLMEAAAALVENQLPVAEALLRAHLQRLPTDVAALRMLAEVAARLRRYRDAQVLLENCLELSPSFDAARHNYALVLFRQMKAAEALLQINRLLQAEPRHPGYRNLKAAILATLGDYTESIEVYEAVLQEYADQPKVWMSYGHALKTAGRLTESIAAYRGAIAKAPTLGEAYWSLANLKTYHFSAADVHAMREQLANASANTLAEEDRLHFEFALAKALEDEGQYAESFARYDAGNARRLKLHPYDAAEVTHHRTRCEMLLSAEFFKKRAGFGFHARDPIFIVGLPRAGSTLIEQILASHSQVEGTMELPDIPAIARELVLQGRAKGDEGPGYPDVLDSLTAAELHDLGARYLADTRIQRKTSAPFFIDKMPNNFQHIGLIQLILPNARIIDARRHPLGCCFSNFKQQFARGQNFTYRLEDIGQYYADYVGLMSHFDAVLPGRIHRVQYERLIDNITVEVTRLLEYCGLPFESQCLRFYENERAVRTASSEQVRQPIFRDGVDHWQHFEPWLGPLKSALGSLADHPHPSSKPQTPQIAPLDSASPASDHGLRTSA